MIFPRFRFLVEKETKPSKIIEGLTPCEPTDGVLGLRDPGGHMEVWGITALMGSGRRTAAEYLASEGFPVIDIDDLSRRLVDKKTDLGKEGFERIYRIFGNSVLNSLGDLDPGKLMKRILTNPNDKLELEKAIDPLVHRFVEKKRIEWKTAGVQLAFLHGARLLDAGFPKSLRGMIRVSCSFDNRTKRVMKRDSMGKEEVTLMFRMQDNQTHLERNTQVNWKNDTKITDLKKQIDEWTTEQLKKATV
jgi:dephospho-CoA kinase